MLVVMKAQATQEDIRRSATILNSCRKGPGAADRLSLELRPGKSVALLGPNGTLALAAADLRRLGRNKQYSVFSVALSAVLYLVIAPQTQHASAYGVGSTAETT